MSNETKLVAPARMHTQTHTHIHTNTHTHIHTNTLTHTVANKYTNLFQKFVNSFKFEGL